MQPLQTPVLFIVFNRTDTATQVLEAIRKAAPTKLYVFADAPRMHVAGEAERCQQARELVKQVDWNCEVKTLFLAENIGPKYAIGRAVNWMFETEEAGIVLEHDCLPHPDFFNFCEAMLMRYYNNERIMHITGNNYLFGQVLVPNSYYFSNLSNPTWGWATWKRAWKHYDADLTVFDAFVSSGGFERIFKNNRVRNYFKKVYADLQAGYTKTWDYQWSLQLWHMQAYCITPAVNLVSNIGFGKEAMHTFDPQNQFANIPCGTLQLASHPTKIEAYEKADRFVWEQVLFPVFFKRMRFFRRFFRMRKKHE
jgi:hypothetical protein